MGLLRLTREDARSLPGLDFSQGQWMSPRPPKTVIITIQTATALSSLHCVRHYTPVTSSHFTTKLSGECSRTPFTDETPQAQETKEPCPCHTKRKQIPCSDSPKAHSCCPVAWEALSGLGSGHWAERDMTQGAGGVFLGLSLQVC